MACLSLGKRRLATKGQSMNSDYVVALEKTIQNKIKQLEEMQAQKAKAQHCSNLIEEINKYRRLLAKAKQDSKKNQRR